MKPVYVVTYEHIDTTCDNHKEIVAVCKTYKRADEGIMDHMIMFVCQHICPKQPHEIELEFRAHEIEEFALHD